MQSYFRASPKWLWRVHLVRVCIGLHLEGLTVRPEELIATLIGLSILAYVLWRSWAAWRMLRGQQETLEHLEGLARAIEDLRRQVGKLSDASSVESRTDAPESEVVPERPSATTVSQLAATLSSRRSAPGEPPVPATTPGTGPDGQGVQSPKAANETISPESKGTVQPVRRASPPPIPEEQPESPRVKPAWQSQIEQAALDVLRRTWQWIIVGEEYRRSGVKAEFAVATNWLVRLFVVITVACAGFVLQHSIQSGWFPPGARVTLCVFTGIGMVWGGISLLGRRYHLLGQGIIGGGFAILYFAFFAAANFYHFIGVVAAFACMALVTCAAGVLSVTQNSLLIAVLGIVGGYATPVMLRPDTPHLVALFSYVLLLGLGILGVAHFRQWLLLNWLGFLGTYGLLFKTLDRDYQRSDFWLVIPFVVSFFVLYSTVTWVYNLAQRKKATLLELLGLAVNGSVFFGVAYHIVHDAYGQEWVSVLTLAAAAFYVGLVLFFLRRRLTDRPLLLTLIALAAFFLTATVPLLLSDSWVTVSWALQALVFLWLAGRVESRFLQYLAYVLYAMVLGRLSFMDLGDFFGGKPVAEVGTYWREFVSRLIAFGVPIASFMGGWRLHAKPGPKGRLRVPVEADVPLAVRNQLVLRVFLAASVAVLFIYLHLELGRMFFAVFTPLRLPVLTALWGGLALLVLTAMQGRTTGRWAALLWAIVAGMLVKFVLWDLPSWGVSYHAFRYIGDEYLLVEAGMRLLDFGLLIAFFGWAACVLFRKESGADQAIVFGVLSLGWLFVFATLEVNTALGTFVPEFRAGGVSVLWALFAFALVAVGIRRQIAALRYTGLVLFAIVGGKVFLSDMRGLEAFYRIGALFVSGLFVLGGAIVYMKNPELFAVAPVTEEDD
jgi:uncharacterized membrane protein